MYKDFQVPAGKLYNEESIHKISVLTKKKAFSAITKLESLYI